ncbi:MAG: glutathione S-transferase family protein [Pseudomonadales bacterium]|nr:glutathione S-transferase family protein [Pseudomonadales bacterium]
MIVLYTMEREYPYGTLRSTNGSKTKVVLEEKGLDYRIELVRPGDVWKKVPSVLARHPLGKVPWIEDDRHTIYDSTVINEYLNDAYPQPPLLPAEPLLRARARALENYGDEGVLSRFLPMIWMPWWSPQDQRDAEAMERGRAGLREQIFPFLEMELSQQGYLAGDFSLADVPFMALAMVLQVDGMELGEFPRCGAYLERLRGRSSYRAIDPATKLADSSGSVRR